MSDTVVEFSSNNNFVIFTNKFTCIYSKQRDTKIENAEKLMIALYNTLFDRNECKIHILAYQGESLDYVSCIDEVEKRYKDLRIDANIREKYNIKRDSEICKTMHNEYAENYSCEYFSKYYSSAYICVNKRINFTTANYYDERIGRVYTKINTSVFTNENGTLHNGSILEIFVKLKEEYEKAYTDTFSN